MTATEEIPSVLRDAITKINSLYDIVLAMKEASEQKKIQEDSEIYLNTTQTAELTHYSEQTIRMKVMGDEIPSFKMNGRRMFRKTAILKWIENGGR